ncbi:Ppx/GppA family phosphatase [Kordiimonas lacus]|uniref:Exopolyphosphatase / guanosine-5'-triphosphate,3'-diphosphate pyrophosphatase n=1 Tax=Kordiimonas lacus TaxID=637679 RepID=A0A1G6WTK2_9PROT|nr:Ppx/GppA family phosphatase [Kordiimonas lacus]SDD69151.1 exopolyphosphatase / guanosine-5'-triphosphate,3'-diphosphate pyrophosphatase [Kordiimonas lacus]
MFEAAARADDYIAVIDIGSNSVRLVVFSGLRRVPDIIFNEKVMCGLGAEIGVSGKMGKKAMDSAVSTLKRFRALCEQMQVERIEILATAAVRDAKNRKAFINRVRKECGIEIETIDGVEEARLAAHGVISAEPHATGIMGDLGGGSLELARIEDGEVHETISLPIGPLRLQSMFGDDRRKIRKHLKSLFEEIPWLSERQGQNLYMVGGAWRNIAKLMMREKSNPLPILQGYRNSRSEYTNYCKRISRLLPDDIPFAGLLTGRRRAVMPTAAIILMEVMAAMKAKLAVVSTYGIREGLIYDLTREDERGMDPFLFTCHVLAAERSRFAEHSNLLFEWTRPLFWHKVPDPELREKLHRAICLLSDIAWRGHPDFRAEKAVESVLHGHFIGVSHRDRAYLAVAMNQAYGASVDLGHVAHILPLLKINEILEARMMGAALRLAQRLSGGTADPLLHSRLRVSKSKVYLGVPKAYKDIANEVVQKRLTQLGQLMGRRAVIEFPNDIS